MISKSELRKLRAQMLDNAQDAVNNFTKDNSAVLTQLIEMCHQHLKNNELDKARHFAYQLFSSANTFKRPDVGQIADMIYKCLAREDIRNNTNILSAFATSLVAINVPNISLTKETEELNKLRQVLRSELSK